MTFDPNLHHRRSVRLRGCDYQSGAYFITICTAHRRPVFGRIENGAMKRNRFGEIVARCWLDVANHPPHPTLDEWVVMPDHFHAIVHLPAPNAKPTASSALGVAPHSLAAVVRSFKAAVTRAISATRGEATTVWQRGFHDHLIRDEKEWNDTRRYIAENPSRQASRDAM